MIVFKVKLFIVLYKQQCAHKSSIEILIDKCDFQRYITIRLARHDVKT